MTLDEPTIHAQGQTMKGIMAQESDVIVYEPELRARQGFVRCWCLMALRIVESRELIGRLFRRDLLAASQQSALGIAWVFITPLIGIASWVFMSRAGVLSPGEITVPYPLFVLIGTTIWGVFMAFFVSASTSLASNGNLLLHIKFSHEALVAQQAAQALVSVAAHLTVLVLTFALYGVWPWWTSVLFPLSLVPVFFLGTGLGMFVAVFAVLVHDMTKVVGTLLGVLMFLTPVIYSPHVSDEWLQEVIWHNPMTYLVAGPRDLLLSGSMRQVQGYLISAAFAAVIFLLSWRLFFIAEQKVVEKV
jgi:lipopolysaccharide transport system permease protein